MSNCRLPAILATGISLALSLLAAEPADRPAPLPAGAIFRTEPSSEGIAAIAFSPDGKLFAVGGSDKKVRIYDSITGKEARSWTEPECVRSLAFSPDGKLLACGSLRDPATGKELSGLKRRPTSARCFAISPDGKKLAVGYEDRQTILWDLAAAEIQRTFSSEPDWVYAVAFSPDGKTLAVGGFGTIVLHDLEGDKVRRLAGHRDWVHALAFSPDGKTLASGSADRTIRTWDLGETVSGGQAFYQGRILKRSGKVLGLAFSPTGRTLVSGGADGDVRLLEVQSGLEMQTFAGGAEIRSVAFAPSGRRVASGGEDGVAIVWDLTGTERDRPPAELKGEELRALYVELASNDAGAANRALWRLVAVPKQAVPYLADQLKGADAQSIAKLVAELDSDQFATRERATDDLEKMGVLAEPVLRKALAAKPSLEVTRRVEKLLETIEKSATARWQMLRALEVLELIGTSEAKLVLESLKK